MYKLGFNITRSHECKFAVAFVHFVMIVYKSEKKLEQNLHEFVIKNSVFPDLFAVVFVFQLMQLKYISL
jgi:hypothetical protein